MARNRKRAHDPAADEAALVGGLVYEFCWHYAPSHITGSAETLRGYRTALELYVRYLESEGVTAGTLSASDFGRARIEGYLDWLGNVRGNSPQTRNVRLSAIRVFCRYAATHEPTLAHLAAEAAAVEDLTATRTKVASISKDAVHALTHAPDMSTAQGRRDAALLVTLYTTACRVGEVLGLRVGDLHLNAADPYVEVVGKGGSGRVVYVPERAAAHVRAHVAETLGKRPDPDAHVFWSREGAPGERPLTASAVTKMMQRHARSARGSCPDLPANVTPHRLRHARATHWLDEGLSVAQVSKLLGHKSVTTTMEYLDITVDAKSEALSHVSGVPETAQEAKWRSDESMSLLESCGFKTR